MTTATTPIADEIDALVEERSLLKHPFYQAWQRGELTVDHLRHYAGQYWHHVLAFPQYVSAAHASCPDMSDRQAVLENLIEEERGDENHPELWLRFGEALGVDRQAVAASEPLPETEHLVRSFREVTREGSFAEAATALYCYESQVPEIAKTKIAGLKEFYGIDTERGLQFFEVHIGADEWHAEVGREWIDKYGAAPGQREKVKQAAQNAVDALWAFLDGVYRTSVASGAAV
jgi:pyrroloquinoline-quinone synthase